MSTIEQPDRAHRMSRRDARGARMTCPRCGLQVRTRRRLGADGAEPEHCPRCIAHSAGALSVPLVPSADVDEARRHGAIVQLASRVLARVTP